MYIYLLGIESIWQDIYTEKGEQDVHLAFTSRQEC